jgi:glycosyltransferase involved in cell wall biosynthesis
VVGRRGGRPHPHRVRGLEARHPAASSTSRRRRSSWSLQRHRRRASGSSRPRRTWPACASAISSTTEFVLYVGNIKPHKNLVRLIEAFDVLRHRGFDDLKLLIIGDEISKLPALRRAVHATSSHKHVRFLGYLPDETLAILYRLAAVFVFPSLYEGFGLPPLEAMASGTPVVTSNVSSLPEVAGDAAVLVDPYDVDSIADGIRRVLTDEALRAELRRKGPRPRARVLVGALGGRTREIYQEARTGCTRWGAALALCVHRD